MDKQLDRLVDLLVNHAMVVVSGTRIAGELGVPHSTLLDWIDRLRAYGVQIQGMPGQGLSLKAVPDILTAEVIRCAARGTPFGAQIRHYYSISSTMDYAARLAQRGAPHGTIVVAEEQIAGRGRAGRPWASGRALGIYCSLVLRPEVSAARASLLALSAGLAVADAVAEITQAAVDLRWPNDVLIAGRKCAGVLPEMTSELQRVKHVVLGIGLNVNQQEFPADLGQQATSLAMAAGRRVPRAEALAALLRALDRRYRQLIEGTPESVLVDFEVQSSYASGKRVSVTGDGEAFTGITQGLDASGFLRIRRDDTGRVEPVLSGTVREK